MVNRRGGEWGMSRSRWGKGLAWGLVLFLAAAGAAAEARVVALDARAGFSSNRSDGEFFHLYQAGVGFRLPWQFQFGTGWGLRTGFGVHAGILRADQDNSFLFSLGPNLKLDLPGGILFLTAGARAGVMSDHSLGEADLGGAFTFDTDVGISANPGSKWFAGYRWQHLSNASIYEGNPSVNLHAVDIGYRF